MDNKEIGIKIARELINFDNHNNENYLPLVDKFLEKYGVEGSDTHSVINAMIHEWSVLGYEIISTHPFKLNCCKD